MTGFSLSTGEESLAAGDEVQRRRAVDFHFLAVLIELGKW